MPMRNYIDSGEKLEPFCSVWYSSQKKDFPLLENFIQDSKERLTQLGKVSTRQLGDVIAQGGNLWSEKSKPQQYQL